MATISSATPANAEALQLLLSQWKKTVEAELQGVPFEKKLVTKTSEGISLQPLYTRADLAEIASLQSSAGEAPFLRGFDSAGYKINSWEFCQEIFAKDASQFNSALLNDLMRGQTSVLINADPATRLGVDADKAAPSQLGGCGLSLGDLKELSSALAGVDVSAVPVHLQTGGNVLPLAALYLSHLASQGLDLSKISGSVCGDPIAEWVLDGKPSASPDSLFDAVASWSKFVASKASKLRSIGVNAELWLEAGGSATQELAFALADAVEQMRALQKRGIPPAQFASQVRFSFSVGQQFFMEIAKFRAFRTLWARVASAFGVEPSTAKVFVHARTALYDKTLHDAHVNMLRVTTEAFSAVLGGVDSLHIGTFDEVSGSGDEFSRRIARNVHTLLSEEFSISETLDPAGGSWYVEKLTDELARKAWALFQETEKQGGLIASLRAGTPQSLVAATAAEKADGVSKRRTGIVGTNLFPNLKEKPLKRFEADEANQSALASAIASRRPASVPAGNASDIASLVAAATKGASLGQLHSLSSVPASGDAITSLRLTRAASGFEELRRASELWAARSGSRPKVFLAKMGPVLQHKARADFAAGFFATGGFESLGKQSFDTAEAAATAALASAAPVVVLCSTDETYPALVPIFAAAIKKASPSTVVILAGLPADKALTEQFKASGIDDFIHIRASVRDLLAKLLKQIGALS